LNLDKRINAWRPDLAAASLKGKVDAARFVEGVTASVMVGRAALRVAPEGEQASELLFGERVTVYDRAGGWAWVQARNDGYVGYMRDGALGDTGAAERRIAALMAPVFSAANLKSPVRGVLPLNARVRNGAQSGDYVEVLPSGFVHRRHLDDGVETDFVAVAERFAGVPYVWGGKTAAGLDCSGLVQTALAACGISAPRDTDMMEAALGQGVAIADARRGDLVFWKGHMGIVLADDRFLHANAFHMLVTIEPLAAALARNESICGPLTSVKRL
jgi:cell wall-associated NlpC family hydrolase